MTFPSCCTRRSHAAICSWAARQSRRRNFPEVVLRMLRGRRREIAEARMPSATKARLISVTIASKPVCASAWGRSSAMTPSDSEPSDASSGKAAQQPGRSCGHACSARHSTS
eukprot:scaffold94705_cov32-Tisochrysis_lutea.AAC.3